MTGNDLKKLIEDFLFSHTRFESSLENISDTKLLYKFAVKYYSYDTISIPLLKRLLLIEPDNYESLEKLLFLYWLNGEESEAKKILKQIEEYYPHHPNTVRIKMWMTDNKYEKIKLGKQLLGIENYKEEGNVYYEMGIAYSALKQPERAEKCFKRAVSILEDDNKKNAAKQELEKLNRSKKIKK